MLLQTAVVSDSQSHIQHAVNRRLRALNDEGAVVVSVAHTMAYHGTSGEEGSGMAHAAMIVYRPAAEGETP